VPYLEELEAYGKLKRIILQKDGRRRECSIRAFRPHGRVLILELEGVEDRSAAEGYVGARLYVERSQLPELEEGQYYKEDLVGAEVRSETGQLLGKVTGFIYTGSNDVLVVSGQGQEYLIPLVRWAVKGVDLDSNVITILPLQDLYEEPPGQP
jgi:16S rRNA processing protein RimM